MIGAYYSITVGRQMQVYLYLATATPIVTKIRWNMARSTGSLTIIPRPASSRSFSINFKETGV